MAERRNLTKAVVDQLKPKAAEYTVWDEEMRRFGVRVWPTGRKVYLLRMRVDGRQRWYTIGPHGDPWTPDTARQEAERVLGQGANVVKLRQTGAASPTLLHPIEARERQRTIPTLKEFAKRYLDEYAIPHKAIASVREDRGLLGMHLPGKDGATKDPSALTIVAKLGDRRVDRITRAEVTAYHLALKETPTRANRALALLSHLFTMAEKWGVRVDASNPCRHVERFAETKRERFLSAAELARLGAALASAEKANKVTPFGLAAVRLLVFTGARASEILGLTWDDVKGDTVRLLRKGRIGTLQLPPPARAVLKALPRIKGNPHVISGGRRCRALTLSGLEQVWQVVRKDAKLEDTRLHDLRHSFASTAAAGGQSLPIIGAMLGHTQPQTTQRYAHLSANPLAAAAQNTAETIEVAMLPKPKRKTSARSNVTPMAGRRRRR